MVKETPNSIGYVELIFASQNQLPSAQVQNAAGKFIAADASSIKAAATAAAKALPSNSFASLTNAPGENSYPIASFTWILTCENMGSPGKQEAMKQFLRWMLEEGQTYVEPTGFARLPKAIIEQDLREIEKIP
jgi:phosphate transport system substrate-binding protein